MADLCRKEHPANARPKYGGREVSHAPRLKVLETKNERVKKMLAESMPDNTILKEVVYELPAQQGSISF